MSECIKHWRDKHLHLWDEALKAKYRGQGKPYEVAEFNKIFKGYDVRFVVILALGQTDNPLSFEGCHRHPFDIVCGRPLESLSQGESRTNDPRC